MVTQPFVDCKLDTLHLNGKQLWRREMLSHSTRHTGHTKAQLSFSTTQLSPETHNRRSPKYLNQIGRQ